MFAAMCSRGIDRGLVQILQIQTSWYLIPLILHTAVVSTARPLLCWRRNGQASWYLCQKHLLWWENIVHRNVLMGPITKPLE